jgi:hypothetical protein
LICVVSGQQIIKFVFPLYAAFKQIAKGTPRLSGGHVPELGAFCNVSYSKDIISFVLACVPAGLPHDGWTRNYRAVHFRAAGIADTI